MQIVFPYDVQIFGFSLLSLVNGGVSIITDGIVYILDFIIARLDNITDLIGMFFMTYQPQGETACFFGQIYTIPTTFTDTATTHTQNTGQLDMLIKILLAWWVFRKLKKQYV